MEECNVSKWMTLLMVLLALNAFASESGGEEEASLPKAVFVNIANTSGTQDGLSWETAFTTIQEGIAAAADAGGGEVWVAQGVYAAQRKHPAGALVLKTGVLVYGGFAGAETEREQRHWAARATVVDGSNGRGSGQAALHVVLGADGAAIDGFTITGGQAEGDPPGNRGGGVYIEKTAPTVNNCLIKGNQANGEGGGMYCTDSEAVIANCVFQGNQAHAGGGMYAKRASVTLKHCLFQGNVSGFGGGLFNSECSPGISYCAFDINSGGEAGGGMFNESASPRIVNSLFQGNTAGYGAGMCNAKCAPMVINCVFEDNVAYAQGGGMHNGPGCTALSVSNSLFEGNTSNGEGGGIYNGRGASVSVLNSNFALNVSESQGGGIFSLGAALALTNSIFLGNKAAYGAGLRSWDGSLTITNCSLQDNRASRDGGGLDVQGDCDAEIVNSILWIDFPNEIADESSTVKVSYSNVRGGCPGVANLYADPLFVDPEGRDFRLQPQSPCIDAGTGNGAPKADIRAIPRTQGSGTDMGAHEYILPAARFTANPTFGGVTLDIKLSDHSATASSPFTSWLWDFGDGTTGCEQYPVHTFPAFGTYTISLKVESPEGSDTHIMEGTIPLRRRIYALWPYFLRTELAPDKTWGPWRSAVYFSPRAGFPTSLAQWVTPVR